MSQILILAVIMGVFLLFVRMRLRRKVPPSRPRAPMHIQGQLVQAYIHPRMGDGCLFDNEVQFGPGFRRKEAPTLPHDAHCGCTIQPFRFTSSEVFNGALRRLSRVNSTLADLSLEDARLLVERLKAQAGKPTPPDLETYLKAVGLEDFPEVTQESLRPFLAERHTFLSQNPPSGEEPASEGEDNPASAQQTESE